MRARFRSFFSYFMPCFLVCIILLLFCIPVYRQAIRTVSDQLVMEYRNKLEIASNLLSRDIAAFNAFSASAITDSSFVILSEKTGNAAASDVQYQRDFSKGLGSFAMGIHSFQYLQCAFARNHCMISDRRIFANFDYAYDSFFRYDGLTYPQWKERLAELSSHAWFSSRVAVSGGNEIDAVIYHTAIPSHGAPRAHMLAILDIEAFFEYIGLSDLREDGFILLTTPAGEPVYTTGPAESLPFREEAYAHKIDGVSYTVVGYPAIGADIVMLVGIPQSAFRNHLQDIRRLMLTLFATAACLSLLAGCYAMYRNHYKSMEKVVHSVAGLGILTGDDNNYQYLSRAFATLNHMKETADSQRIQLNETVLLQDMEKLLLFGKLERREQARLVQRFPIFACEYRVIVMSFEEGADTDTYVSAMMHISEQFHGAELFRVGGREIVIVLPAGQLPLEALVLRLESFSDHWRTEQESRLRFAISLPGRSLEQAHGLYEGCVNFLKFIDFQSVVIAEHLAENVAPVLTGEDTRALTQHLTAADAWKAKNLLYRLWHAASQQPSVTITGVEQLYYSIRAILCNAALKAGAEIPQMVFHKEHSLTEHAFQLTGAIDTICEQIRELNSAGNQGLGLSILKDIGERYHDSEFSILTMTEKYDCTRQTIDRACKARGGKTFFENLEDTRLGEAEKLLLETGLAIQDIAGQCGFYSQNTFTKAFKRRYLQSPSAYRSAHENTKSRKDERNEHQRPEPGTAQREDPEGGGA